METTKAERIRLGIFVLCVSSMILGTAAFLVGKKITEKYIPYKTRFMESVDGLNPGAKVKLNGIVVGQVTHLEVDKEDLTAVIVNFEVSAGTPVKTTMTANLIGGISLTGLKSIELSGGAPGDPNTPRGDFIKSSVSGLKQISGQAEIMAEKIESIMNNLLNITNEYNQRRFTNIATNLDNITTRLDAVWGKNTSDINEIPKYAKQLLENSNAVAEESKTTVHRMTVALAKLDSLLSHTDKKVQNMPIEALVKSANDAAKSIELLAKRSDQLVYRNQEDLSVTVRYLREAVENLNDVSRQVRENPSLLIRGEEKQQRVR
ncbi:MAG: MlaD family protein [Fibromonadaceae bacterium]|jgi:phospholipid/cholesterol/gamma-HCH transport system substrate-binding protein|nr:MlaD family protein [Fibromonadaceae bacterium]